MEEMATEECKAHMPMFFSCFCNLLISIIEEVTTIYFVRELCKMVKLPHYRTEQSHRVPGF
jgi:hypothetical protein